MTYSAGQVVEVCSERSRGWTSGFNYGSKITLTRLITDNEGFARNPNVQPTINTRLNTAQGGGR